MSAAAILKLQASGFSVEQVSALAELVDTQAATKADVEAASHKLDQKIDAVRTGLDQKIDGAEHRLELKVAELKSDLEATEHRLEAKIADVRTGLDQKIDGVEHRLELKIGELKAGLELKVEGLDRKITEVNANTLKWVISAIGFQTLLMIGTVVGAVAALMKAIPQTPLTHP
ncbi:hypothetical protein CQW49_22500 (plasmid) [Methylosinus trichosporium OB3b]|uniref:DUF1640 domain-containing protein n=1 Tax=Methylosinus trichosporium (strain ATCC 35070 / NCIMB 11131 / UNIQEM 75 / OB3b) TaxID=595536 RepID=A0A2D2D7D7_METT3|nr:hypothetical protein [Methylosinus trichosporium]ATQ70759.1 hypothetical protein CQW49_22500 [Methylosinus trichosporium OB3b]